MESVQLMQNITDLHGVCVATCWTCCVKSAEPDAQNREGPFISIQGPRGEEGGKERVSLSGDDAGCGRFSAHGVVLHDSQGSDSLQVSCSHTM